MGYVLSDFSERNQVYLTRVQPSNNHVGPTSSETGRCAIIIITSLNSVGQNLNEKLKTWMTVKMNEYRCRQSKVCNWIKKLLWLGISLVMKASHVFVGFCSAWFEWCV